MNQSKTISNHPFWIAIAEGDLNTVRAYLEQDASLAHRDFRPTNEQDPHTFGFPIVKAADTNNLEMVDLLLEFGADIDAKSPTEEQRELGNPIMHAFERRRYDVIHFLLDRGASVAAYGWCYPSLVDLTYEEALKHGAKKEIARKGFTRFLGPAEFTEVCKDAHDSSRLFARLLDMGGQPSVQAVVKFRYYDLAQQLLRTCPNERSTRHDYPHGSVFESTCWAASWHGIPKVVDLAMRSCPSLFDCKMSIAVLRGAVRSHNRIGLASEYYELIETQLNFLRDTQQIQSVIEGDEFLPHFMLAENYLWPGWCGDEKDPSTVESMIELSELFIQYGFTDLSRIDPEAKETALARANSRADHPGLPEFAAYLRSRGAEDSSVT